MSMTFLRRLRMFKSAARPAAVDAPPSHDAVAGLVSFPRDALAPLTKFTDIPVVPAHSETQMVLSGGPVWPNWDAQIALRHQRSGLAVDPQPPVDRAALSPCDEPAIWGGHIVDHFGHFLAEHGTRLLCAARMRPDLQVLMTLAPNLNPQTVPAFFWQILNWYGIPPRRVRFVTTPMLLRELWAIPMAEQWAHVPPSQALLDLLDDNATRHGMDAPPQDVVYVTRDRFEKIGGGHNAGEAYLTQLLPQLGVTVIRPETVGLRDQLAAYSRARVLIFAEGSALHGRQLLGRRDQHIVILNRRPNMRIGLSALHARCTQLSYGEVTKGLASVQWPNGAPWLVRAISIYDTERLLALFAALGLPLQDVWDQQAFARAEASDLRNWLNIRLDPAQPIDHSASKARVTKDLRQLGFDQIADELHSMATSA